MTAAVIVAAWFLIGIAAMHLAFVVCDIKEFRPIYVWMIIMGPVLMLSVVVTIIESTIKHHRGEL